jgi:hypothetical protein
MQTKKPSSGLVSGILMPMGLVCLFAFCSLALALLGGQAYKNIQTGVDDSYGASVASAYLRTKISQANRGDEVLLRDEGGVQLLVIRTVLGGATYETRIYMHEGRLMESHFEDAEAPFNPAGGVLISRLSSCAFNIDGDGLFTAEIVGENGVIAHTAFAVAEGGNL